nr:hypothetical protein [Tanacetum cinerariifolium]
ITMVLLLSGFLKHLYPDIMDMINDQDIEHTISPTPPPDYPLMSYLSGRGMKLLESEPVDRMAPKRTSTSVAPAMNQAAIRKLVADSVAQLWKHKLLPWQILTIPIGTLDKEKLL